MTPSPSTPAITTPDTPDTPDTPAIPPAPSTGTVQSLNKPRVRYGAYIEGIALEYSLHPVDVAIGIAGVLTNIAGPHAGLVDSGGGRVKPHLSLLRIGSTASRLHLLERRLFHPLRTRANWLRQSASSHSRRLIDNWVFASGDPPSSGVKQAPFPFFFQQRHADAAGLQEKLFTERGLNPEVFDEISLGGSMMYSGRGGNPVRNSPGAVHLPSVFFEGTSLEKVATALSETIHREALLLMPAGGVFDPFHKLSSEDEPLARDLAALLRGRDTEFAPLHPDQGPGTFEHARVHLWATMTLERLGDTLQDEASPWNALYDQCLLWDGSAGTATQDKKYKATNEWQRYDHLVHDLLQTRCYGTIQMQSRLLVPPSYEPRFQVTQDMYLESLEDILPHDSPCMAQFCDLPARLLWVFLQFRADREEFWCGKAAFTTAQYAAKMHAAVLNRAREKHAEKLALKVMDKVTAVLLQKGPCKLRELVRSCNQQSAAYFKPALNLMERQGLLQVDEQKRFRLVGPS